MCYCLSRHGLIPRETLFRWWLPSHLICQCSEFSFAQYNRRIRDFVMGQYKRSKDFKCSLWVLSDFSEFSEFLYVWKRSYLLFLFCCYRRNFKTTPWLDSMVFSHLQMGKLVLALQYEVCIYMISKYERFINDVDKIVNIYHIWRWNTDNYA